MSLSRVIQDAVARLGINILRASGAYAGYWAPWRAALFDFAEARGLHVLPVHYYTPIPTSVDTNRPRRANGMAGISFDVNAGADRASRLIEKYRPSIDAMLTGVSGYNVKNSGFHPLDAAVLYGMIRSERPRRIIEIGSGMSTVAMLAAIKDGETKTELICIEPYLPEYLKARRAEISEIVEKPLQEVPLSKFSELEPGDILFIDSTHVVRFESDVVYEILEILPRLKPGVIIHVHDIFFPNDYPAIWLKQHRFFWAEQYMLQAFLSMNSDFTIEIPLHAAKDMMDLSGPLAPSATIETTSLWMRRNRRSI